MSHVKENRRNKLANVHKVAWLVTNLPPPAWPALRAPAPQHVRRDEFLSISTSWNIGTDKAIRLSNKAFPEKENLFRYLH